MCRCPIQRWDIADCGSVPLESLYSTCLRRRTQKHTDVVEGRNFESVHFVSKAQARLRANCTAIKSHEAVSYRRWQPERYRPASKI